MAPPAHICLVRISGQLVSVSNLTSAQGRMQSSVVHLRVVCTEPAIREHVDNIRNAVQDNTLEAFAQKTAEGQDGARQHGDARAAEMWKALLSLFRANSRDELVALLGYSKEEVKSRIGEVLARLKESQEQQRDQPQEEQPADTDESTEQVTHEPVVSFAEPEPKLEIDGEQVTGKDIVGSEHLGRASSGRRVYHDCAKFIR